MPRKPEIQYVGQFYVHGSEAQVLAPDKEHRKAKTKLPLARLEKVEKVYVDPVALVGIAVAVVMLITMVFGALQIQTCWEEYEVMSEHLSAVKRENAQLTHTYRSNYDLEEIRIKALAIGMVPKDEVETITVIVTPSTPKLETTLWDDIVWFLDGLFE